MKDSTRKIIVWILVIATVGGLVFSVGYNVYLHKQAEKIEKQEAEMQARIEEAEEKKAQEGSETASTGLEVGKKIVDFTLKDLDGNEVSVSDFEGKVVIINFWATWCAYCDQEMPDFQKLVDEDEDVVVLAVNVEEDEATVRKYIEKGGYDFNVVLDTEGDIAIDYFVSAFPSSYFVDKDGIFHGRVPGMLAYEDMVSIVEDLK